MVFMHQSIRGKTQRFILWRHKDKCDCGTDCSWEFWMPPSPYSSVLSFAAGIPNLPHQPSPQHTDQGFGAQAQAGISLSAYSRGLDCFQIPPLLLWSTSEHIHSERIEGSEFASSIIQKIHRSPQQGNEMDDSPQPLFLPRNISQ